MKSTTGVLCAIRGSAEGPVVRELGAAPGLEVTRRCAELAELVAAAAAGLGRVAVVSGGIPGLDRTVVDQLRSTGTWVVVLPDDAAPERLGQLGADTVADGVDPAAVVAAVLAVLAGEPPVAAPEVSGDVGARPVGRVVAVWGPTGAPGRTTVAVTVATELVERGAGAARPVLLVDADTYGGTVAQVLGMLDEAPGIAAAARAAGTGRLDTARLAALAPRLDGGLRVLTGISRAARWPELSGPSLEVVWSTARDLAGWTVVDCGFCLEQDEALSYDTRAPARNAATISALTAADVVVVVGAADPVGLQRLVRGLSDLDDLGIPPTARLIVVNRVRPTACGRRPRAAVREALRRFAGVEDVLLVPDDGPSCDAALLAGRSLTEHARGSPVRQAVADVTARVLSLGAGGGAD